EDSIVFKGTDGSEIRLIFDASAVEAGESADGAASHPEQSEGSPAPEILRQTKPQNDGGSDALLPSMNVERRAASDGALLLATALSRTPSGPVFKVKDLMRAEWAEFAEEGAVTATFRAAGYQGGPDAEREHVWSMRNQAFEDAYDLSDQAIYLERYEADRQMSKRERRLFWFEGPVSSDGQSMGIQYGVSEEGFREVRLFIDSVFDEDGLPSVDFDYDNVVNAVLRPEDPSSGRPRLVEMRLKTLTEEQLAEIKRVLELALPRARQDFKPEAYVAPLQNGKGYEFVIPGQFIVRVGEYSPSSKQRGRVEKGIVRFTQVSDSSAQPGSLVNRVETKPGTNRWVDALVDGVEGWVRNDLLQSETYSYFQLNKNQEGNNYGLSEDSSGGVVKKLSIDFPGLSDVLTPDQDYGFLYLDNANSNMPSISLLGLQGMQIRRIRPDKPYQRMTFFIEPELYEVYVQGIRESDQRWQSDQERRKHAFKIPPGQNWIEFPGRLDRQDSFILVFGDTPSSSIDENSFNASPEKIFSAFRELFENDPQGTLENAAFPILRVLLNEEVSDERKQELLKRSSIDALVRATRLAGKEEADAYWGGLIKKFDELTDNIQGIPETIKIFRDRLERSLTEGREVEGRRRKVEGERGNDTGKQVVAASGERPEGKGPSAVLKDSIFRTTPEMIAWMITNGFKQKGRGDSVEIRNEGVGFWVEEDGWMNEKKTTIKGVLKGLTPKVGDSPAAVWLSIDNENPDNHQLFFTDGRATGIHYSGFEGSSIEGEGSDLVITVYFKSMSLPFFKPDQVIAPDEAALIFSGEYEGGGRYVIHAGNENEIRARLGLPAADRHETGGKGVSEVQVQPAASDERRASLTEASRSVLQSFIEEVRRNTNDWVPSPKSNETFLMLNHRVNPGTYLTLSPDETPPKSVSVIVPGVNLFLYAGLERDPNLKVNGYNPEDKSINQLESQHWTIEANDLRGFQFSESQTGKAIVHLKFSRDLFAAYRAYYERGVSSIGSAEPKAEVFSRKMTELSENLIVFKGSDGSEIRLEFDQESGEKPIEPGFEELGSNSGDERQATGVSGVNAGVGSSNIQPANAVVAGKLLTSNSVSASLTSTVSLTEFFITKPRVNKGLAQRLQKTFEGMGYRNVRGSSERKELEIRTWRKGDDPRKAPYKVELINPAPQGAGTLMVSSGGAWNLKKPQVGAKFVVSFNPNDSAKFSIEQQLSQAMNLGLTGEPLSNLTDVRFNAEDAQEGTPRVLTLVLRTLNQNVLDGLTKLISLSESKIYGSPQNISSTFGPSGLRIAGKDYVLDVQIQETSFAKSQTFESLIASGKNPLTKNEVSDGLVELERQMGLNFSRDFVVWFSNRLNKTDSPIRFSDAGMNEGKLEKRIAAVFTAIEDERPDREGGETSARSEVRAAPDELLKNKIVDLRQVGGYRTQKYVNGNGVDVGTRVRLYFEKDGRIIVLSLIIDLTDRLDVASYVQALSYPKAGFDPDQELDGLELINKNFKGLIHQTINPGKLSNELGGGVPVPAAEPLRDLLIQSGLLAKGYSENVWIARLANVYPSPDPAKPLPSAGIPVQFTFLAPSNSSEGPTVSGIPADAGTSGTATQLTSDWPEDVIPRNDRPIAELIQDVFNQSSDWKLKSNGKDYEFPAGRPDDTKSGRNYAIEFGNGQAGQTIDIALMGVIVCLSALDANGLGAHASYGENRRYAVWNVPEHDVRAARLVKLGDQQIMELYFERSLFEKYQKDFTKDPARLPEEVIPEQSITLRGFFGDEIRLVFGSGGAVIKKPTETATQPTKEFPDTLPSTAALSMPLREIKTVEESLEWVRAHPGFSADPNPQWKDKQWVIGDEWNNVVRSNNADEVLFYLRHAGPEELMLSVLSMDEDGMKFSVGAMDQSRADRGKKEFRVQKIEVAQDETTTPFIKITLDALDILDVRDLKERGIEIGGITEVVRDGLRLKPPLQPLGLRFMVTTSELPAPVSFPEGLQSLRTQSDFENWLPLLGAQKQADDQWAIPDEGLVLSEKNRTHGGIKIQLPFLSRGIHGALRFSAYEERGSEVSLSVARPDGDFYEGDYLNVWSGKKFEWLSRADGSKLFVIWVKGLTGAEIDRLSARGINFGEPFELVAGPQAQQNPLKRLGMQAVLLDAADSQTANRILTQPQAAEPAEAESNLRAVSTKEEIVEFLDAHHAIEKRPAKSDKTVLTWVLKRDTEIEVARFNPKTNAFHLQLPVEISQEQGFVALDYSALGSPVLSLNIPGEGFHAGGRHLFEQLYISRDPQGPLQFIIKLKDEGPSASAVASGDKDSSGVPFIKTPDMFVLDADEIVTPDIVTVFVWGELGALFKGDEEEKGK
nr:hypothetical protein [Candidatus Omnitrophota bacterium]